MSTIEKQASTPAPSPRRYSRKEVHRIIDRASAGDRKASARLRVIMKTFPQWRRRVIKTLANESKELDHTNLKLIVGKFEDEDGRCRYDQARGAAIQAKCRALRNELAPEGSSMLRRLLAGRVVSTWLALTASETCAGRIGHAPATVVGAKMAEANERFGDRANRRFVQALRALQELDRPAGPSVAIQVNNLLPEAPQPTTATVVEALPPSEPSATVEPQAAAVHPGALPNIGATSVASKETTEAKRQKAAKEAQKKAKQAAKAAKKKPRMTI